MPGSIPGPRHHDRSRRQALHPRSPRTGSEHAERPLGAAGQPPRCSPGRRRSLRADSRRGQSRSASPDALPGLHRRRGRLRPLPRASRRDPKPRVPGPGSPARSPSRLHPPCTPVRAAAAARKPPPAARPEDSAHRVPDRSPPRLRPRGGPRAPGPADPHRPASAPRLPFPRLPPAALRSGHLSGPAQSRGPRPRPGGVRAAGQRPPERRPVRPAQRRRVLELAGHGRPPPPPVSTSRSRSFRAGPRGLPPAASSPCVGRSGPRCRRRLGRPGGSGWAKVRPPCAPPSPLRGSPRPPRRAPPRPPTAPGCASPDPRDPCRPPRLPHLCTTAARRFRPGPAQRRPASSRVPRSPPARGRPETPPLP